MSNAHDATKLEVLMTGHGGRYSGGVAPEVVIMRWADFLGHHAFSQHQELLHQRFPTDHDARQLANKSRYLGAFAEESFIAFRHRAGQIISAAQALAGDDENGWKLENVITRPGCERMGHASAVCQSLVHHMWHDQGRRWFMFTCVPGDHSGLYERVLCACVREEWDSQPVALAASA